MMVAAFAQAPTTEISDARFGLDRARALDLNGAVDRQLAYPTESHHLAARHGRPAEAVTVPVAITHRYATHYRHTTLDTSVLESAHRGQTDLRTVLRSATDARAAGALPCAAGPLALT